MKKLILTLALIMIPVSAFGYRIDGAMTATTDLVTLFTLDKDAKQGKDGLYEATVNIGGTFNGCTVHWLVSTDGGTNKVPFQDSSGAVTSTAADNFAIKWGWPSGSASAIFYASAAGCSGAPTLVIDIDDDR